MRYQLAVDRKEKIIVGVNDYVMEEKPIETLQIDESVARRQEESLRQLRAGAIGRGGAPAARRSEARRRGHGESDALPLRSRESLRHAGRNLRCAPRRFSARTRRSPLPDDVGRFAARPVRQKPFAVFSCRRA